MPPLRRLAPSVTCAEVMLGDTAGACRNDVPDPARGLRSHPSPPSIFPETMIATFATLAKRELASDAKSLRD
jgi:hypothetical protein